VLDGENRYSCSLALYPLGMEKYEKVISNSILKLYNLKSLEINVGDMSTVLKGDKEDILQAIDILSEEANNSGDFLLNINLSNVCGLTCDN